MLIFDHFSSKEKAEEFANFIKQNFGLITEIYDNGKEAQKADHYPFPLTPFVVLVERKPEAYEIVSRKEEEIVELAAVFGGNFAGT